MVTDITGNEKFDDLLRQVRVGTFELKIGITNEVSDLDAYLKPVTLETLGDSNILKALTIWRNANMENFMTNFEATPERTRLYLKNTLNEYSRQMLFLIYEGGELVGQVGFKDLNAEEAIMDNGMRGERSQNPKIMVHAHRALAIWLFKEAKIKQMIGWLFADNITGIMMNKQIGWSSWVRHPLEKVETDDGAHWQIGAEGSKSSANKYCFKLIMKEEDLLSGLDE
ncbi:MAG: hypothetical protein CBB97_24245 [Candidatus Endolissoclinum sp. TMED37]|nr:MAG: hypothetical protein CBB97_24245 [Candidatus Endolissoclinum sp. TMED37]|tara:strand:+ start:404 stop:1081 length:678 start_codon:yes stop_codon:yes gene_type:complete